ncbi:DUF7715 family protein [Rathayibacter soli]
MEILVATARTQGARGNDYHWCIEGELLWIQEPCASGRRSPDEGCGCGRGFAGMNSHRATTTAAVADLPDLDRNDFVTALRSSLGDQGWPTFWTEELADGLLALADHWPVGTVIERRLDEFGPREIALDASP